MSISNLFGGHGRAVAGGILLLLLGVVFVLFLLRRSYKRKSEVRHEVDSFPTPVMVHGSASGLVPEENFDVFINHRGPDVKAGFVKKLDESLRSAGIRPFLDAYDINCGHQSWDSITKAIKGAPICICVFSPGYAESKWCLDELAFILKLRSEKLVLPVFYNVKPMHLKRPDDGPLSEGLKKVSERYGLEAASRWRGALLEIANTFGDELITTSSDDSEHNSRLEANTVHKLVKNIHQHLKALFPVSIGQRASHIIDVLQGHPDKACTIGLWGVGGVGKTTLATEIFKRVKDAWKDGFDGTSYLGDVARKYAAKNGGLEALQTQLLSDLSGNREVKVIDIDQGRNLLKQCLQSKRVLIVVDNVEDEAVRNALCIDEYLGIGSWCLVTSRSSEVCSTFRTTYNYEVELLQSVDARQLFCWHAFDSIFPGEGFEELASKISTACGGLPLALKTIGSLLNTRVKDICIWEEVLLNLQRYEALEYNDKLFHQLKISFDYLQDREKEMFLDVACFLLGTEKDIAEEIWKSLGWSVKLFLQNLERKCLLKVENNRLTMHDLFIDMGHKIVSMESRIAPGERSRLWMIDSEQVILAKRTTRNILSFSLAGSKITLLNLDFNTMENLRFLNLDQCSGDVIDLPKSLRYVRWHKMPMTELPRGVYNVEQLAVLDLTASKMRRLWDPNSDVTFTGLRALILVGCTELTELPDSLTRSGSLLNLDLNGCLKLVHLPESMGGLTSLTDLNLRNCSNLISLPESIGSCVKLGVLNLVGCLGLVKLPHSVGRLCNLVCLYATDCSRLTDFPDSMKELSKLKVLMIGGGELKAVPLFIEHLAGTLERLNIHSSKIKSLPDFVFKLTKLKALTILDCHLLLNVADRINGLKELYRLSFVCCKGLKRLPDSIGDLINLEELGLEGCGQLENLPKSLGQLKKLQVLQLNMCISLVEFPDAESIFDLPTSCRQRICDFVQFKCERNIMKGEYDAAEQDLNYIMMLKPGDPTFQRMHMLISENKCKKSEALLSTDFEWLRQQAWQKVMLNDMGEAKTFIDRMVEVDSESLFALMCRIIFRDLVDDAEGHAADLELLKTVDVKRKQAGKEVPQLFYDSRKIMLQFKHDSRGALLAILKVESNEEAPQSAVLVNDKPMSLPGKEELAASAWKPQPAKAAVLQQQAKIKTGLGDHFGALVHLDAADKLDPDNVSILSTRGEARFRAQDYPGAYRDTNRVLELNPNHFDALISRAQMRSSLNPYDLEGALADCERAMAVCAETSRNCSIPLLERGLVKCKMGDFDGALIDLESSYLRNATDNTLLCKEGLLKWKRGDYEGALDDLGWCYEMLPSDSPLRYKKEKVELPS